MRILICSDGTDPDSRPAGDWSLRDVEELHRLHRWEKIHRRGGGINRPTRGCRWRISDAASRDGGAAGDLRGFDAARGRRRAAAPIRFGAWPQFACPKTKSRKARRPRRGPRPARFCERSDFRRRKRAWPRFDCDWIVADARSARPLHYGRSHTRDREPRERSGARRQVSQEWWRPTGQCLEHVKAAVRGELGKKFLGSLASVSFLQQSALSAHERFANQ